MLILTRKAGESLVISDDVIVKVLEVRGDHVKLGITAPREVSVYRQEVFQAIKEENLEAAKVRKEVFACLAREEIKNRP